MASVRTTLVALYMLTASAAGAAQQSTDAPPREPAADQGVAPADSVVRPKRGKLLDVLRAVVPPLVDSATRPPPVQNPAPYSPPQPIETEPALPAPVMVEPVPAVAPTPPPRPVQAQPAPASPRSRPAAIAPKPAPPAARSEAPRPVSPPAEPALPEPPPVSPSLATQPPPVAVTLPELKPLPIEQAAAPADRDAWWPFALLAVAAIAVVAGLARVRRMRQIARTRALLGLNPKLDPALGSSSISGLSLTAPPFSIHARLAPAHHG